MRRLPAAAFLQCCRAVLLLLLLSCAVAAEPARDSLAWAGPYQGLVPCADCEGIATLLELTNDGHFRLNERYEGRSAAPVQSDGTFTWDAAGNIITLDGTDPPRRFRVGAGRLWMLDLSGQVITGDLAEAYVLTKAD